MMKSKQLSLYVIVDIFLLYTWSLVVSAQSTPNTTDVSTPATNGSVASAVNESTTSATPTNATVAIQTSTTVAILTNATVEIQPGLQPGLQPWSWASVPDSSREPYDACGNVQQARVCDPDYVLTQTQRAAIQGAYVDMLRPSVCVGMEKTNIEGV